MPIYKLKIAKKIPMRQKTGSYRDLVQRCPQCGKKIGVVSGSKDAICTNCGFKDPCCE